MERTRQQEPRSGLWASFDYGRMAREAAREQAALRRRLQARQEAGPASPGQMLSWQRENSMLYAMYLEQKHNAQMFQNRAGQAAAGCPQRTYPL